MPTSHPADTVPDQGVGRAQTLIASFRYAFVGVGTLLWSQRNAKLLIVLGLIAAVLGALLRIERGEWLAVVLAIVLLIAAKGFNAALTAVIDLASSDNEPLANVARQVAAGTVLLTVLALLVVELIVFVPHVLHHISP